MDGALSIWLAVECYAEHVADVIARDYPHINRERFKRALAEEIWLGTSDIVDLAKDRAVLT